MDFGIARFSRSDGKTLSDKTIGSVHYISPEQARGDITDEKSDIYSVGVMLYEMLTGKKPFDAENPGAVALMHMQEVAKNPREIISTIPEPLEEIVYHAMERNPSRRYQSASEMMKDIEAFKHNPDIVFGYKNMNEIDSHRSSESTIFFNPVKNDESNSDDSDIIDVDPNAPAETYNNYADDYYDEEDEEPAKKRSYVVPILSAVTVAVVIIAAVVILFMVIKSDAFGSNTNKVEIPNFIGQSIVDAKNDYSGKLVFIIESDFNDEYAKDIIYEQDIPQGTIKKEGSEIKVKVSKGPKTSVIPDLKNQTYEAAKSMLESLNLVPMQSLLHDDDIVEGRVIKTNPETNEEVPQGSSITVFVSSGPLETKVKVPSLVGRTEDDAKALLEENKLKCEVEKVDTDEVDKGKVVSQSISKGTSVDRDTVITIGISTGKAASKTVNIDVSVPVGAWGSYKLLIYVNGNLENTQSLGDAETVAGSSVRVPVTGQGEQTVSIKVQRDNKSEMYGSYNVNFAEGTYSATSTNSGAFSSITPEKETTETDTTDSESETTSWSLTTTNNAG